MEYINNFKFIYDKKQIDRFQELVYTPESFNTGGGVHQICISLSKEYKNININKQECHFNYFIINENSNLYCYIRRYEVPVDAYIDKDSQLFDNNKLCIQSTLAPRDSYSVIESIYNKYVESIKVAMNNKTYTNFNLEYELKSKILKKVLINRQNKIFVQLDINDKSEDTCNQVIQWLIGKNIRVYFTTETRESYHIVINRRLIKYKYQNEINKLSIPNVNILGFDQLLIIPGTLQGDFKVRFADEITNRINIGEIKNDDYNVNVQ